MKLILISMLVSTLTALAVWGVFLTILILREQSGLASFRPNKDRKE